MNELKLIIIYIWCDSFEIFHVENLIKFKYKKNTF